MHNRDCFPKTKYRREENEAGPSFDKDLRSLTQTSEKVNDADTKLQP